MYICADPPPALFPHTHKHTQFLLAPSCLISHARLGGGLTPPASRALGVNSHSVAGPTVGRDEAEGGDLVWILKCPLGWWQDLGIGGVSFSGTDEIIMHRVGARLKFAHENPLSLASQSSCLMCRRWQSLPLTSSASSESQPTEAQGEWDRRGDVKWRRQNGVFFLLCFLCVLLLFIFKRGILTGGNIF